MTSGMIREIMTTAVVMNIIRKQNVRFQIKNKEFLAYIRLFKKTIEYTFSLSNCYGSTAVYWAFAFFSVP
jgi:hypothetical protein